MTSVKSSEEVLNDYVSKFMRLKVTASPELRYRMYGYYMQATQGDCYAPKPPKTEVEARRKWKAWKSMKHLTRADAKNHFTEKVRALEQLEMIRSNSGQNFIETKDFN
ncbi:diazepam-binding inhibitor-like 5 [Chrysoperla carnea]|uniref:diazepam-binding inhibitor-like 5 n=1 Tax=Chrysoperla carnea TaxID=189513 RepID=UPI001D060FAF|nr:diazepam-binding inhibitor-like 5 [Chrysoperla carnea]